MSIPFARFQTNRPADATSADNNRLAAALIQNIRLLEKHRISTDALYIAYQYWMRNNCHREIAYLAGRGLLNHFSDRLLTAGGYQDNPECFCLLHEEEVSFATMPERDRQLADAAVATYKAVKRAEARAVEKQAETAAAVKRAEARAVEKQAETAAAVKRAEARAMEGMEVHEGTAADELD